MCSDDVRARAEALLASFKWQPGYGDNYLIPRERVDALRAALAVAPATASHPSDMPPGFDWNPPLPDDAPTRDVLLYALRCAKAWEPGARLLGNLRACDLSRALTDTLTEPATGDAAAVREACARVCEENGVVTTPQGKRLAPDRYKPTGAVHEGMVYAAAIRALPLPAPATAVEEARKAFYEAARDFWITASSPARTATHGPSAISRLNKAGDALLTAEAAATSRSDDRPASGQGGV